MDKSKIQQNCNTKCILSTLQKRSLYCLNFLLYICFYGTILHRIWFIWSQTSVKVQIFSFVEFVSGCSVRLCQYNIDFQAIRGYIKLKMCVLDCQETADFVEGSQVWRLLQGICGITWWPYGWMAIHVTYTLFQSARAAPIVRIVFWLRMWTPQMMSICLNRTNSGVFTAIV